MDRDELNEVRRANLREFVRVHCGGKKAEMISKIPADLGKEAYWRGVLSTKTKKSFSWQKARETEPHLGLVEGELEIPNSTLRLDPARIQSPKQELLSMIQRMQPHEHADMLRYGARIFKNRTTVSASAKSRRA